MKTYSAFLTFAATAATGLLLCGGVRADPAPVQTLTIDNHQKLVTVKDATGAYLFAQVLPSPNLKIVTTYPVKGQQFTGQMRVSLQDATGKTLWMEQTVDSPIGGDWTDSWGNVLAKFFKASSSISEADGSAGAKKDVPLISNLLRPGRYGLTYTIGPLDQVVSEQLLLFGHQVNFTVLKDGTLVSRTDFDKDVVVILPQQAPAQTPTPGVASVAQTSTP